MCICFVRQPRLPFSYHYVCVLFCSVLCCLVLFLGACGGGGSPATSGGGDFTPLDTVPVDPITPPVDPVMPDVDGPSAFGGPGSGLDTGVDDAIGIGDPVSWERYLGQPTPGTIADPVHYETDEYFNSGYWTSSLDETGFSTAYARGWTGRGSLIAIADTGVDPDHPDLAANIGYVRDFSGTGMEDNNGHGTHVAGIVGAVKDDYGVHGAAFDAQLAIGKVTNTASYSFDVARDVAAWSRDLGAVAINVSAAYTRNSWLEPYLVPIGTGSYYLDYAPYQTEGYYYARQEAREWRTALGPHQVLVKAAGNDGTAYSAGMNQMATATDDDGNLILNGQMLIVGNWNADYGLITGNQAGNVCVTWHSNQCHDAAKISDYFLLAPGVDVFSTYRYGSYATLTGTSMAAPMVAAGIGVLHQMWPHMTGTNLAQLALQTADRDFAGYAAHIHGQGILDMDRATQPVGATGLPLTGRTDGGVTIPAGTIRGAVITPAARAALGKVMVLDRFERDFYIDLAANVTAVDTRRGSVANAAGLFNVYAPYFDPGHHASHQWAVRSGLSALAGVGVAKGEYLGVRMQGSLGTLDHSTTAYGLLRYHDQVGPVSMAAQIGMGLSHLTFAPSHSLLSHAEMVQSSSWGVTGIVPVTSGYIGVGVAQPVTVEAAPFHYRLPVGRSLDGRVHYATRAVDFKAGARELDTSLFYRSQVAWGGELTLAAEWRHNLAYETASDEMLTIGRWRLRL